MTDFTVLPSDLPHPVDDGACDHLPGLAMPSVRLPSTDRSPGRPGRARPRQGR